jgi:hypothetical protein
MRVVRKITYEGTEEQLVRQLKQSSPDMKIRMPHGVLEGLVMQMETIEEPDSKLVHEAIAHNEGHWPEGWFVKDDNATPSN